MRSMTGVEHEGEAHKGRVQWSVERGSGAWSGERPGGARTMRKGSGHELRER